ncbi:receptor-type protein kinase, putative, partial [Bodo saltans]
MSHEQSPCAQSPCRKPTDPTVASAAPTKRTRAGSAINTSSPASEPVRIVSIQQPRSRNCLRLLQLRHLTLDGYCRHRITDAGVVNLASLQQLRHLSLHECNRITDAGLVSIAPLQQLRHLDLYYCYHITDAGLVSLASLQQL